MRPVPDARAHARAELLPAGGPPAWAAADLVRGEEHVAVLTGRWAGVRAVVACAPTRVLQPGEDPFALLDEGPGLDAPAEGVAVGGGWLGALGYALAERLERVAPPPPPAGVRLPDAILAFYDHVLVLHADGRWAFEALWTPGREGRLRARRDELAGRVAAWSATAPRPELELEPFACDPTPEAHAEAVAACVRRIEHGDLFQANLALRLRSLLRGDPAELHARGARALSPDRGALLRGPWGAVASLSPELHLERHRDHVRSAPIKGTRPSGAGAELAASAKDHAENVMIVDLVRNDLGRTARPGSVAVPVLAQVRPHAGVEHLVSEVVATLPPGTGHAELVRGAFPPGSVTGAPKLAAMDVIAELESSRRGIYTGAIVLAGPVAGLELSVAIRTFEVGADGACDLQVGGGVVADSDGEEEAREALDKARPLLRAVGGRLAAPGVAPRPAAPPRTGPRPRRRPDPARGLLETVLVRGGEAVALDAHLARLRASAQVVFGLAPSGDLEARAEALARTAPAAGARLRIVLTAAGAELALGPLPVTPTEGLALRSHVLPGGLGARKWADRDLLDALTHDAPGTVPLLLDADGFVLEAAFASVVVVRGGERRTPPLDGRILPGTTRARAGATEAPLTLADLHEAEAVLLLSALRGAVPATSVDGRPLPTRWPRGRPGSLGLAAVGGDG